MLFSEKKHFMMLFSILMEYSGEAGESNGRDRAGPLTRFFGAAEAIMSHNLFELLVIK